MKKWIWGTALLLVAICTICITMLPTEANAATVDDLTYEIAGGEVTITDCNENASGELVIPDAIEGCPVTAIGNYAFFNCRYLTKITIPDGVVSLGDDAFSSCTGLQFINIPGSVITIGESAFYNCGDLQSITIPDSVTTIDSFAFSICGSLRSVTIPQSVTYIGDCAFWQCDSLTEILVDENNPNYCNDSMGVLYNKGKTKVVQMPTGFRGEYVIPNSVTTIGNDAFRSCSYLQSISIPNSVTAIGDRAFHTCTGLNSITIPDTVTSIGYMVFAYSVNLQSFTVPDTVTSIGDNAFYFCTGLQSVVIPASVKSIGRYAFQNCDRLDHILYTGTESQWNTINIDTGNTCLTDATRHNDCTGEELVNGVCTICNPIALGDADGDGFVDAYDASLIKKYSVGAIADSDLNISVLDLDGDRFVDAYDASLIQKYSVGAITKFPIEE